MVYTGATVGGVTTGGWHEEKAYYSQEVSDSGKSKLKFKGKDGGTIKKIILTADLIASAKQQPDIKQFLKDDTLELQHLDCGGLSIVNAHVLSTAIATGNVGVQALIANEESNKKFLTHSECQHVLDWICNK